ncbi:MAG: glycoside hydrolase family 2 [Ruminococcaceae bacterium]|nr:glycoside hydrolase family 2 [Oscillospiraceae bacterium]
MLNKLYTSQGEALTGTPWELYPRPQLRRESYINLNGIWTLSVEGQEEPLSIRVPFCPESLLSGVNRHFPEGSILSYRRNFRLPEGFNKGRVLLHIGAADQIAEVYINKKFVGCHEGGYTAFTLDITDALEEENLLEICCTDDLRDLSMPYGKQTLRRGGMWYTPVSGIWQSVWLESVPIRYIEDMRIENRGYSVHISIYPALNGKVQVEGLGEYPLENGRAVIEPKNPQLWSPENPYLYSFKVVTEEDTVDSYFAIRFIDTKVVDGIPRLCLNGKPYFFHGLLDQGYWPDGIYTPASPECYVQDIIAMKRLGFNTLRKHIKVEAEEFYYQCDRLGMIVFQDMVNNSDYSFIRDTAIPTVRIQKLRDKHMHKDAKSRERFLQCMEQTVAQLRNHPCILYWTVFNEGWGQFDSDNVYQKLRTLDDTRIIDTTSGWFRRKCSDVESLHIYFGPWNQIRPAKKPLILSEFGGYAYAVEGHLFNPDNAYGYKTCANREQFQSQMLTLYQSKVLPAIKKGLCGAICTQVSDVEDEINGFLTYDRKVCKADEKAMTALAAQLQAQLTEECK